MPRIKLLLALLCALLVAVPVAHAAGVSLSYKSGFALDRKAQTDPDKLYSSQTTEDLTASCGKTGTAIGAGWSGSGTFVSGARAQLGEFSYITLDPRETPQSGKLRGVAICAKGAVGATVRRGASGKVTCGSGKLALGLVAPDGSPYDNGVAAEARATSKSTWTSTLGDDDGRAATVICVKASAFKRVTTVSRAASFAPGAETAAATATCTGGRRPIGWGVELPAMPGNAFRQSGITNMRVTPFPATSEPSGRSAWKTVFRTPDFKGAAAPATATLHVTCAAV